MEATTLKIFQVRAGISSVQHGVENGCFFCASKYALSVKAFLLGQGG
jgi:hypothetical protein